MRGPFAIWMRNPAIADAADKFGTILRQGSIDKWLFELMVLIVARHYGAQYEWYAHARHAPRSGPRAATSWRRSAIAASLT